jgi:hypothetical protein
MGLVRRGAGRLGARTAGRTIPWARLLALAEAAPLLKSHWDKLSPGERRRVQEFVRKSRGRPANLTKHEREELRELVTKLDLRKLARDLAAIGWRRRRGGR